MAHRRASARLAARLRDQPSSDAFSLLATARAVLAQIASVANATAHRPIHSTSKWPSAMLSITW